MRKVFLDYKQRFIFILVLLFSLVTFLALLFIFKNNAFLQQDNLGAAYFLNSSYVKPEPFERFCYIFGLFYLPVAFIAFYQIFNFIDRKYGKLFNCCEKTYFNIINNLLILGFVVIAGYYVLKGAEAGDGFRIYFSYHWLVTAVFFLVFLLLIRKNLDRMNSSLFFIIGIIIIGVTSLTQIMPEESLQELLVNRHHFSLLVGVVNQVLHGKTILVDLFSQYGILYPYFIVLFTKILGFNILNISIFFVLLIFLSYFFIYLSLWEIVRHNSLLLVFFLIGILGIVHPFYETVILFGGNGPYYQYTPLRLIFGTFFSWFVLKYLRSENKKNYFIGLISCGISFLWNLDTGIVLTLSWLGFLTYTTISKNNLSIQEKLVVIIKHILGVFSTIFLTIIIYSFFAYLRSHKFPLWLNLFTFQNLYFRSGYFMLPIPSLVGLWNIQIFIYAVAFLSCLMALLEKRVTDRDRFKFFLVLFGLGIFTYYLGRSHMACLFPTSYPALILVACLLDEFSNKHNINKFNWKHLMKNSIFQFDLILISPLCLIFAYGMVGVFKNVPITYLWVKYNITHINKISNDSKDLEIINFINRNKKSKEVIIFSDSADYLYCKTDTFSSLPFSSLAEVITRDQAQEINEIVSQKIPEQIFMEVNLNNYAFNDGLISIISLILPSLQENYKIVAKSLDSRMVLLERYLLGEKWRY